MTSIYLGWVDDTPKRPVEEKIRAGAAAFLALFHAPANVCVCSTANAAAVGWTVDGIPVGSSVDKGSALITTPNLFLLGRMETAEALGDYRQARGALQSGDDTPSEVVMRRMRNEGVTHAVLRLVRR